MCSSLIHLLLIWSADSWENLQAHLACFSIVFQHFFTYYLFNRRPPLSLSYFWLSLNYRKCIAGRELSKFYKDCALCDKFLKFSIKLGIGIRFPETTAYTLVVAPYWPLCTISNMAAIRSRKCHISATGSSRSLYNTTFFMFFGVSNLFLNLLLCYNVIFKVRG